VNVNPSLNSDANLNQSLNLDLDLDLDLNALCLRSGRWLPSPGRLEHSAPCPPIASRL
jgi:hypothetical protein